MEVNNNDKTQVRWTFEDVYEHKVVEHGVFLTANDIREIIGIKTIPESED